MVFVHSLSALEHLSFTFTTFFLFFFLFSLHTALQPGADVLFHNLCGWGWGGGQIKNRLDSNLAFLLFSEKTALNFYFLILVYFSLW